MGLGGNGGPSGDAVCGNGGTGSGFRFFAPPVMGFSGNGGRSGDAVSGSGGPSGDTVCGNGGTGSGFRFGGGGSVLFGFCLPVPFKGCGRSSTGTELDPFCAILRFRPKFSATDWNRCIAL